MLWIWLPLHHFNSWNFYFTAVTGASQFLSLQHVLHFLVHIRLRYSRFRTTWATFSFAQRCFFPKSLWARITWYISASSLNTIDVNTNTIDVCDRFFQSNFEKYKKLLIVECTRYSSAGFVTEFPNITYCLLAIKCFLLQFFLLHST